MADHVRMDPEKLNEAQKRFAALSDTVEQMQTELGTAIEPLQDGAWQGEAFDAFAREMIDEVIPARRALLAALQAAATKLSEIAATFRDAEEQARQSAGAAGP